MLKTPGAINGVPGFSSSVYRVAQRIKGYLSPDNRLFPGNYALQY